MNDRPTDYTDHSARTSGPKTTISYAIRRTRDGATIGVLHDARQVADAARTHAGLTNEPVEVVQVTIVERLHATATPKPKVDVLTATIAEVREVLSFGNSCVVLTHAQATALVNVAAAAQADVKVYRAGSFWGTTPSYHALVAAVEGK